MTGLLGLTEPWLGAVGAFGALLALLAWLLLRDATPRARAIAAAFGGVLLFVAVSRAFGGAGVVVAQNLTLGGGGGIDGRRQVIDLVLLLVGVVAGVATVLGAHEGLAEVGEELADDDDDRDDDDDFARARVATVSLTPWVDLLALAVALALPIGFGGDAGPPGTGDVTVLAAVYHLLAGFMLAAPLLVAAARDDLRDWWPAVVAFGLVAATRLLLPFTSGTFANEYWVPFARGLVAGLVAAVAVPLVARGLRRDRTAGVAGAVIGLVLVTLNAFVGTRTLNAVQEQEQERFADYTPEIEGDVPPPPEGFPTDLPDAVPTGDPPP